MRPKRPTVRRMLRVQLLGDMAVDRDGTTVDEALPGPVARLLAFLALHPGPHARDALADRFWPDVPTATGRARLRTAVWTLRRAVGADAVLATRGAVGLAPDGVWVDAAEVARRAEAGESAAAVALCAGELLAAWPQDWVVRARADHREREAVLLDRLAVDAETAGDADAAARWSRRRCALTPLDEPAHTVLLRRLAATGDRAGALLVARELVTRLRDELAVGPAPATRAAIARLRGSAAASHPSSAGSPVARRPLFGRRAELATLTAAWSAAREGLGRVVLVTGEGGIGKTRLVTELAGRADNVGARVAVGAGVDVGGEAPLALWQELVRELVRIVPAPPDTASWPGELGRLAPDLAHALGRPLVPAPVAAPELERLRIADAVVRLVEWACAGRPVLLVVEDVHRADRASLQLATHLGRRAATLPLLVVLTRRDRPARSGPDALVADLTGRGVPVDEIDLGPLDGAELASVAQSVAALDDADVARAVRAADGSPLLAVESARALAGGSTAPPSSLRARVRAATRAMGPVARELLECVAAAGRPLRAPEIAALGLDGTDDAEREVLDTGLARRAAGGLGFRHALLAEAARADLPDPERRHERVALALEAAAGEDADAVAADVARHLQRAGRDDLAGPRWRRAAVRARAIGALPEAAAFWTEAVHCAPEDAEPRLELAETLAWMGRREGFETQWWAALERLAAPQHALAWIRRGTILRTVACHPTGSLEAYRRAEELLPADAPAPWRAEMLLGLGWGEASLGEPDRAEEHLAAVGELVGDPDPTTAAEIENVRLMAVIRLGRFAECEAVAHRGAAAARRADRPDLAYALHVNAACALGAGGDLDGALRIAEESVAATRGITVLEVPCRAGLAFVLARLDRHEDASAHTRELLVAAERLGADHLALARHDAGLVALAASRYGEAAELLDHGLRAGGGAIRRPATRLARAEALAGDARPDEAARELRRAVEEPVGTEDQPWALVPRMTRVQGLIARARGDREEAARRLTEASAAWRRTRADDRGTEFMSTFVDLGRPPIVGLVEPDRELARVTAELADLHELPRGVR